MFDRNHFATCWKYYCYGQDLQLTCFVDSVWLPWFVCIKAPPTGCVWRLQVLSCDVRKMSPLFDLPKWILNHKVVKCFDLLLIMLYLYGLTGLWSFKWYIICRSIFSSLSLVRNVKQTLKTTYFRNSVTNPQPIFMWFPLLSLWSECEVTDSLFVSLTSEVNHLLSVKANSRLINIQYRFSNNIIGCKYT